MSSGLRSCVASVSQGGKERPVRPLPFELAGISQKLFCRLLYRVVRGSVEREGPEEESKAGHGGLLQSQRGIGTLLPASKHVLSQGRGLNRTRSSKSAAEPRTLRRIRTAGTRCGNLP